jgi:V/A-type H+-transporting ATPase subunit I
MKKVTLIVHRNYIENVIERLHKKGLMQIIDIAKDEPKILEDSEKAGMHPEAETCAIYELRLTRLIDILKRITPHKKGIKSILSPELLQIKNVSESSVEELFSYAEGYLDKTEKKILEKEEKLQALNERQEKIKQDLEKITYLVDFDFNLSDIGESKYLIVKAGITKDIDFIKEQIKKIDSVAIFSKQFGTKKEIEWAVLLVAHKKHQDEIEKISKASISEFSFEISLDAPKDAVKQLKKEMQDIQQQKNKIISELRVYSKAQLSDLLALREEIKIERIRKEISTNFAKTNSAYIIKGWILEKDEQKIKDELSTVSNNYIIQSFEKPNEKNDKPPTYIKTPWWAEGFKSLVNLFSVPRYNEINPTVSLGIFFILFFGIMLGDAGYGLVLLCLSLFGFFKLGKHSKLFREWSFMGIWMGTVATIFGFLTNSFFGDLVPRFIYGNPEAKLYEFDIMGIHITPLVDPIKDPVSILVLALILGLIHLNIGLLLGIIQTLKQKKFKELITTRLCWVSLQIGGGILIGKLILGFQLSDTLMLVGVALVVIGFIQLFVITGPLGFFSITGYVGDWLSYARILALGLSTGGMALAFNVISQLLSEMIPSFLGILILMLIVFIVLFFLKILNRLRIAIWTVITVVLMVLFLIYSDVVNTTFIGGLISIILVIIMLLVLHVVNLILQSLGAAIHSLRLHYVEFFNRFYEGGGYEFSPFEMKRKYTKVEEKK